MAEADPWTKEAERIARDVLQCWPTRWHWHARRLLGEPPNFGTLVSNARKSLEKERAMGVRIVGGLESKEWDFRSLTRPWSTAGVEVRNDHQKAC